MSKRRFRRLASLSAALAAGASAQTIPVHPVGKIVATSTDAYGDVFGVRVLSDGRVLVNDSRFRRVVLLDTALRPLTVVADTSTSTSRAYGARPGNLIAYGGDTTIFVDPASNSFLFIDPKGAIVRTAAPPRPTDIATFATPSSAVTYDGRGSLVYRPPLLPRLGLVQPQDDSTPLVRVNLTSHALDTIAMLRRGILHAIVVPCAAGTSIVPGPDRTCMTTPRAPFTSGDEWALLSTGAIAVIRSIDYHVDWVTPDGKRTATPKVAHEWTRLTDSAKRWLVDSLRGDEAYYWMWGQKLAWSYFDHPPLHAWLLHVAGIVLGWNYLSLRILTWLSLGGTLLIFWLWARRLKPEAPGDWFWPSAALYLASPLFFLMSSIAFHDHLLIFLCLASAHLFLVFAERWEANGRGFRWLYAAAAVLGLAVLTKYNGVLVGVGVAVFFVARKELRPLFRTPHLYLAAVLAVAIQAPVFWWNATEGFASYKFHLSERWGGSFHLQPFNLLEFVALAIAVVSPFLFPAIFGFFRRPLGAPFADRTRALAISVFITSTLAMAFISLFVETFFYWNITAFLLLMPLLTGWVRRRWALNLHYVYGLLFAGILAFNNTVAPIANLAGGTDWTNASTFGWPAVADRVTALKRDNPVGFIAVSRYTTAAQLGYALHDADVTAISDRPDEYDYWFDAAAHEGQNALIVSDPQIGLAGMRGHFDSVTRLESVPYSRFGIDIYKPTIYLGQGFHAESAK